MTTTNQEKGIKDFQLSVDFFDKPEICAVTVEHGIRGQAATIMLLCTIYKNGYFIEWKPENYISILKELPGIVISRMEKIVKTLVEWGFFDKTAFEEHQVLTNQDIQQQFLAAHEGNIPDANTLPYWLTDDNGKDTKEVLDDNEKSTDKALKENKQETQKTKVIIGEVTFYFPARPSECIEPLMQDQPWVMDMCKGYNIEPKELREWLETFAIESEEKGKKIYNDYDDLMEHFDYWMITGYIKSFHINNSPAKNAELPFP